MSYIPVGLNMNEYTFFYSETGKRCPVDNMAVEHQQLFKDNFAKREVLCLNVLCSANENGCFWHGELRDLQVVNNLIV